MWQLPQELESIAEHMCSVVLSILLLRALATMNMIFTANDVMAVFREKPQSEEIEELSYQVNQAVQDIEA